MNKKIYLEMRESPEERRYGNPYSLDVYLTINEKTSLVGKWIGKVDCERIGYAIAQKISDLGFPEREVVLPNGRNKTLDGIEEVLRQHSENKIVRDLL